MRFSYLALLTFLALSANAVCSNLYFSYAELTAGSSQTNPNTTSAVVSQTINGATNTASANLATGYLGVLNVGTSAGSSPGVYETIAQLGDTITASGPASGLPGLNLGVSIQENATTSFSNPAQNFSWLWVYILTPGSFDQTTYTSSSNVLAAYGYLLGNGTDTGLADALFAANNVPVTATYGDGANSIALNIPFSTIGSNFQIELVVGSAQNPTAGTSWSADLLDPINASLSAPPGVTLASASGEFPGTTAAVPEPRSWALLGLGTALLVGFGWRRRHRGLPSYPQTPQLP
jgi:hypothetical protein